MLRKYFNEKEYDNLVESDNLLYKALEIVSKLFKDKVDKGGIPYSVHLLRVYDGVSDYNEKVTALLHDTLEDTDVSVSDLEEIGIPKEITDVLVLLTKNKGEDYGSYIARIINGHNIHALNIKLADLTHNMEVGRIKNPTINDYERINKRYAPARERILEEINNFEIDRRK